MRDSRLEEQRNVLLLQLQLLLQNDLRKSHPTRNQETRNPINTEPFTNQERVGEDERGPAGCQPSPYRRLRENLGQGRRRRSPASRSVVVPAAAPPFRRDLLSALLPSAFFIFFFLANLFFLCRELDCVLPN